MDGTPKENMDGRAQIRLQGFGCSLPGHCPVAIYLVVAMSFVPRIEVIGA